MKKYNNFKILWHYLKDEKPRLILYMLLVLSSYLPVLFAAYFWGKALEFLILKDIMGFIKYLALWEGIYILLFSFLQIPRDKI